MVEDIELQAKLKLDTSQAQEQLSEVADKASKASKSAEGIKLPKEITGGLKEIFSGDKGLKNLSNIARGAAGGIRGLGNALTQVSNSLTKGGGLVGLIVAIAALVAKLVSGTDTWEMLTAEFGALTEMVQEELGPAIAYIGELLITAIRAIKPILQPILQFVSAIVSAFDDIGLDMINRFADRLTAFSDRTLKPLLEWLTKMIGVFDSFRVKVQDFVTEITGGLIKFSKATTLSTTGQRYEDFKTSLDTWEQSGQETATEKAARLAAEAAGSAKDSALATEDATITFGDFLRGSWDWIKQTAASVGGWISKVAKDVWSDVKGFALDSWDAVTGFAKDAWSWVESAFKTLTELLRNAWSSVSKGVGEAGSYIAETASSIWDKIKTGVSDAWGKIFKHSNGGTISAGAQLWGMNEVGNPEFLFNAGGRDTVVNGEILADAVFSGVAKAMATANNSQRLEVSVKDGTPMGQRELAQWLLPALKFALGR